MPSEASLQAHPRAFFSIQCGAAANPPGGARQQQTGLLQGALGGPVLIDAQGVAG